MVRGKFEDHGGLGSSDYEYAGWRCITCGAIVDPLIAAHRRLTSQDVQEVLGELFLRRGRPTHIRSDNGYVESFTRKLRDEWLNGERFYTLRETQVLVKRWRRRYNTQRPYNALGYRPPAPETRTSRRSACRNLNGGLTSGG